ncbi:MAG: hypothetical protein HKN23_21415 [Verrucomicrobiales bacterium]|nr:hypothetical protein [Verrucomicrobiales bacterium]
MPAGKSDWYCVRTRPKSEHLAAAHLSRIEDVDTFCPRIRFEKATSRGPAWFVEALFPGYLFAKFELEEKLRHVNGTPNVTGILRFGDLFPTIAESFLDEIRSEFPAEEEETRIIQPRISEGDEVEVVSGPMRGLKTVVTRLLPAQERVAILLDWLGEEREAEVSLKTVKKPGDARST